MVRMLTSCPTCRQCGAVSQDDDEDPLALVTHISAEPIDLSQLEVTEESSGGMEPLVPSPPSVCEESSDVKIEPETVRSKSFRKSQSSFTVLGMDRSVLNLRMPQCWVKLEKLEKQEELPEEERHRCARCGAAFRCARSLARHERMHSWQHRCQKCNCSFHSEIDFLQHLRKHALEDGDEDDVKPFRCMQCLRCLSSRHSLERHLLIHKRKDMVNCTHCSAKFLCKSQLERHRREEHKEVYAVSRAPRIKIKTEPKPVMASTDSAVSCPYCDERFKLRTHMRQHLAVHEGPVLPYSCSHCSAPFRNAVALRNHRRFLRSIQERTHSCQLCSAAFPHRGALREHVRIEHAANGKVTTVKQEPSDAAENMSHA